MSWRANTTATRCSNSSSGIRCSRTLPKMSSQEVYMAPRMNRAGRLRILRIPAREHLGGCGCAQFTAAAYRLRGGGDDLLRPAVQMPGACCRGSGGSGVK